MGHRSSNFLSRFLADEAGATAIEYGLIAGIVGLGILLSLTTLKTALVNFFTNVATKLGTT